MRKLYRSRTEKIIGGVAGGMAQSLGLDTALIRLVWLLFVFMGGIGLPVYIVAWIIIPEEPFHGAARNYNRQPAGYQGAGPVGADKGLETYKGEGSNDGVEGLGGGVDEEGVEADSQREFYDASGEGPSRETHRIPGASDAGDPSQDRTNQALGLLLVIIGVVFLLRETVQWDIFRYVWPALFIILGVYILFNNRRG